MSCLSVSFVVHIYAPFRHFSLFPSNAHQSVALPVRADVGKTVDRVIAHYFTLSLRLLECNQSIFFAALPKCWLHSPLDITLFE